MGRQGVKAGRRQATTIPLDYRFSINRVEYMRMEYHAVRKTYKYRLCPTPAQALEVVLWRCRELYNAGLEERKASWEKCGVSVNFAMQSAQLPGIKEVRPE